MDREVLKGKVVEVGIDSIMVSMETKDTSKFIFIPNTKVNYIEYRNGEKYFVKHDLITLINEKIIIADVGEITDTKIFFDDLQDRRLKKRHLPVRKVLSVFYRSGDEVYFFDRVNLLNGHFMVGEVVEVSKENIVFKNARKKNAVQTIAVSKIRDIAFKNGYRQHFVRLEN